MMNNEFSDTMYKLKNDEFSEFSEVEKDTSTTFNILYYGAAGSCTLNYEWLWSFVKSECPEDMDRLKCVKCYDYSIANCPIDQQVSKVRLL